MARPAPNDSTYAPSASRVYTSPGADVLLAEEFPEQQWAATELWLSIPASFAGGNLVVRMQAAPTVDVTVPVSAAAAAAGYLIGPIRGAFTTLRSTTTAGLSCWFFWQGGPA